MATDPYAALASVYDRWQAAYGSFADSVLGKLEPSLHRYAPAATSFADVGCGTGTLLLAWGARHPEWRLCGVDGSPAMLDAARAKPGAGRIRWEHAELGQPLPGRPYDVVGCFFNTLNHLPDQAALARALGAAGAALAPGGLLVFDVNNAVGFEAWWRGARCYEGRGWRIELDATYDSQAGVARASVRATSAGATQQCEIVERLFRDEEIAQALASAGLSTLVAEPWAPMAGDAPGATWWIARRS